MKKQILVLTLSLSLIAVGLKAQNDHTGHGDHAKKEKYLSKLLARLLKNN